MPSSSPVPSQHVLAAATCVFVALSLCVVLSSLVHAALETTEVAESGGKRALLTTDEDANGNPPFFKTLSVVTGIQGTRLVVKPRNPVVVPPLASTIASASAAKSTPTLIPASKRSARPPSPLPPPPGDDAEEAGNDGHDDNDDDDDDDDEDSNELGADEAVAGGDAGSIVSNRRAPFSYRSARSRSFLPVDVQFDPTSVTYLHVLQGPHEDAHATKVRQGIYAVAPLPRTGGALVYHVFDAEGLSRLLARSMFRPWIENKWTVTADMYQVALDKAVYGGQGIRVQYRGSQWYFAGSGSAWACRAPSMFWLFMRAAEMFAPVPEFDVAINLGDHSKILVEEFRGRAPPLVLSESRRERTEYDVLIPDFAFHHYNDVHVGMLWREVWPTLARIEKPLHETIPTVFWRGMNFGRTREAIRNKVAMWVQQGKLKPTDMSIEWVDVRFPGSEKNYASLTDICGYKYVLTMEGYAWTARNKYLLACGSVVIMQETPFEEYFKHLLRPWVHYVPFSQQGDDLLDVFLWLEENPIEAARIARAGRDFAFTFLGERPVLAYFHEVIVQASALQPPPAADSPRRLEHLPGITSDDVNAYGEWFRGQVPLHVPWRRDWLPPDGNNMCRGRL